MPPSNRGGRRRLSHRTVPPRKCRSIGFGVYTMNAELPMAFTCMRPQRCRRQQTFCLIELSATVVISDVYVHCYHSICQNLQHSCPELSSPCHGLPYLPPSPLVSVPVRPLARHHNRFRRQERKFWRKAGNWWWRLAQPIGPGVGPVPGTMSRSRTVHLNSYLS